MLPFHYCPLKNQDRSAARLKHIDLCRKQLIKRNLKLKINPKYAGSSDVSKNY